MSRLTTPGSRNGLALLAVVVALVVLAACDPLTGGPTTTLEVSPRPTATQAKPSLSPEAIANAVRFRTTFGLRADEGWIREVAADPRAWRGVTTFGTPLTPEELAELRSRLANADAIIEIIEEYARSVPGQWAGTYIEHEADGVVALFTGDLEAHRAEISRRVHPNARFEVRHVRWSLMDLDQFRALIDVESGWFTQLGAPIVDLGTSSRANRVELLVASRDPAVVSAIERHFGNPDWLRVDIDGIGVWHGPRGSLRLRVVLEHGEPVPYVDCIPEPDDPAAYGDGRATTDADGVCRLDELGATWYTVAIEAPDANAEESVELGRTRVRITGGGEVRAAVAVREPQASDEPEPTAWDDESRD